MEIGYAGVLAGGVAGCDIGICKMSFGLFLLIAGVMAAVIAIAFAGVASV